ncbi:hypothetical protein ACFUTU_01230 [Arthrobacter sp. NPDC057388]|uniref:OB-fold protein n=1 Tax=Arthrobacter sp. NPDC057388 TaxID=3346116 RepID=UPI00362C86F4
MTENTTVPEAPRNGKAQAAADKAYRKASRPWFKKKRFLFPLIIVALMIISGIANGGKEEPAATVAPSTDASAVAETSAAAAPAQKPAPAQAVAPAQTPAPAKTAAPKPVSVEAAQLLADFEGNEAAADVKYKGKVLQVTGHVAKVDTEFLDKDQYVVRLDDGSQYSIISVNCNDVASAQAAAVVPDSTVTVQGTFKDGGDLGVEIKDCRVL